MTGKVIRDREDNSAFEMLLSKFASPSAEMMVEIRQLFLWTQVLEVTLLPKRVTSEANAVDGLSRWHNVDDWRLPGPAFAVLERRFGPHDVDRIASENTALLPQ